MVGTLEMRNVRAYQGSNRGKWSWPRRKSYHISIRPTHIIWRTSCSNSVKNDYQSRNYGITRRVLDLSYTRCVEYFARIVDSESSQMRH